MLIGLTIINAYYLDHTYDANETKIYSKSGNEDGALGLQSRNPRNLGVEESHRSLYEKDIQQIGHQIRNFSSLLILVLGSRKECKTVHLVIKRVFKVQPSHPGEAIGFNIPPPTHRYHKKTKGSVTAHYIILALHEF